MSTPLLAHAGDGGAPVAPPPEAVDWLGIAESASRRAAGRAPAEDHAGGFPGDSLADLHASGLFLAPAERAFGGAGLAGDPAEAHRLYAVLAAIGRASLPLGRLYEGHVNALALVEAYGTEAQRRRAAHDAARGELFGVWNTEAPSDGVRLVPLPGGRVRLEGAKTFCSGAGRVTRILTTGALDGGWQMVLVPTDRVATRAEPETWTAEGMRATASGRVDFSGAVLETGDVLGAPGDYLREPHFNGGAVRFAAVQLGGAEALAQAAAGHLRALGRTEAEVQRLRMGEVSVALETGRLWLLGAARLAERGAPDADVVAYAQHARTAVERVCLDVLERVDRAVGARGMLPPCAVERVGRDLRLYLRQPNPDGALAAAGTAFLGGARAWGSDL